MILFVASLLTTLAIQPDAYRLNSEGRTLLDRHRYAAAVRVFQRAVVQAEAEIGPRDPATAMMLRNLALAYVEKGDCEAAERSAKLAYAMVEARFGADDPALTPILNVLAESYFAAGQVEDTRTAAEHAVAIGAAAGAHYGIALHNLGALREFVGDAGAAAALYRRAIEAKSATLGAAHPYVRLSQDALRRVEKGRAVAGLPVKLEPAGY